MVSGAADGEAVKVVGQDAPSGPGPRAGVALEAAASESVAAFEVADAPFGADAEVGTRQASGRGALAPALLADWRERDCLFIEFNVRVQPPAQAPDIALQR